MVGAIGEYERAIDPGVRGCSTAAATDLSTRADARTAARLRPSLRDRQLVTDEREAAVAERIVTMRRAAGRSGRSRAS